MYKLQNGWTKERMIEQIYLKNNGTRSVRASICATACFYRGQNDNACGIGCFIPDGVYGTLMEGLGAYTLFERFSYLLPLMPLDEGGMARLQSIHDMFNDVDDVRVAMKEFIEKNVE